MEKDKNLFDEESYKYDASDRPFDYVEVGVGTALVCESDRAARQKISSALRGMGYQITEPTSMKDAAKNMRFHTYDVVVLSENFETANPDANAILNSLANLNSGVRRQMFVALLSERFRTMDNMTAFNKSVNVIINVKNIDDVGIILKCSLSENAAFYHVFKEALKKKGWG